MKKEIDEIELPWDETSYFGGDTSEVLIDTLTLAHQTNKYPPEWAIKVVCAAADAYMRLETKSFDEFLAVKPHKHQKARRFRLKWDVIIWATVNHLHEQDGIGISDELWEAARMDLKDRFAFDKSASYIRDVYREYRGWNDDPELKEIMTRYAQTKSTHRQKNKKLVNRSQGSANDE